MRYEEWEAGVPTTITGDPLWRLKVYRLALFLSDLAWSDSTRLLKDRRAVRNADQLFRAATGIAPQISEGYSRSSGKDQARFFEYALGSAREARDWYYSARRVHGEQVFAHRTMLLSEIIRMTIVIIPTRRAAPRISKASRE